MLTYSYFTNGCIIVFCREMFIPFTVTTNKNDLEKAILRGVSKAANILVRLSNDELSLFIEEKMNKYSR